MNGGKIYKYVEYGILFLGIILFVKYSGITIESKHASAFEWEKEINVYFLKSADGSTVCPEAVPLRRMIPNAEIPGPAALNVLIQGLNLTETESGYSTAINKETLLQKFEMKDATAYVDFSNKLDKNLNSCEKKSMLSQIEKTLLELPNIYKVVISVDDKVI